MKSVVAAVLVGLALIAAWGVFALVPDESPDALDGGAVEVLSNADRSPSARRSNDADSDSATNRAAARTAEESPPLKVEITVSGVECRKNDRSRFSMGTSFGRSRVMVAIDSRGDGVYTTDLPDCEFSEDDGLLPHVTVTIDHPRAERFEGTWHLDALPRFLKDGQTTARLSVRLLPAKTIRGVVVDDAGRPIEGAVVGAYDLGDGIFPPIHENIARASIDGRERTLLNHNRKSETCPITDAAGRFEIRVPLRERMLVAAASTGFEEAAVTVDGSDATPVADLELHLRTAVKISGRATIAGRPLRGTVYATPIGGPNLGGYDPRAGYQGPIDVFSIGGRIVEWLGGTKRTAFTGGEVEVDADGRFSFVGVQDGVSHDLFMRPTDADDIVIAKEIALRLSRTVIAPADDFDFDCPAAILDISVNTKAFEGGRIDLELRGDAFAAGRVECRAGATQKVLWPPLGSVEISIRDRRFEMPTVYDVAPRNGEVKSIVLEPKAVGGCPQLSLTLTGEDARRIKRIKVRWTPLDDETASDADGAALNLAEDTSNGRAEIDGGLGYGKPYDPSAEIRLRRGIDIIGGLENETLTDVNSVVVRDRDFDPGKIKRRDLVEAIERGEVDGKVTRERTFIWSKIDVADGRYRLTFSPMRETKDFADGDVRFVDIEDVVVVTGESIHIKKAPVRGRALEVSVRAPDGRSIRARCEIADSTGTFADDGARRPAGNDAVPAVIETAVLPYGRRIFRITADGHAAKNVEVDVSETSPRIITVVLEPIE